MPTITVDVRNFKKVGILLRDISDKTLRQAVARSIARTITTVRKEAVKEFRSAKLISMKSGTMKKRIRAYNHAKATSPVASQFGEVAISGKAESMARFFARETQLGTRVGFHGSRNGLYSVGSPIYAVQLSQIGKEYAAQYSGTPFFMRKGGMRVNAVMVREGSKRLPIQKMTGPSLGKLAQDHGLLKGLEAVAQRRYGEEFERNLNFYAARAIARAKAAK